MEHIKNKHEAASKRAQARKIERAEFEARRKAIRNRTPFKGLQIRPTASLFDDAEQREPGGQLERLWIRPASTCGVCLHGYPVYFYFINPDVSRSSGSVI